MEKLGIQRKEGKKASVSQPPLPAQESREGSASPHCSAEGGCGRHRRGPTGRRSRSRPAMLEAKSTVLRVLAGVWDGHGEGKAGACSLAPPSGGRQSCVPLPSDLVSSCPPWIPDQQGYHSLPLLRLQALPSHSGGATGLQGPQILKGCVPHCPSRHTSDHVLEIPFLSRWTLCSPCSEPRADVTSPGLPYPEWGALAVDG